MNSSTYLIFALLACIGTLCSAQINCYSCRSETNPKSSVCWTDPASVAGDNTYSNCETECYSDTFQSGGLQNDTNIWFIERGCSTDQCVESDNCKNKQFGACRKCCTADKCNVDSPSGSGIVKVSLLVVISAVVLTKLID